MWSYWLPGQTKKTQKHLHNALPHPFPTITHRFRPFPDFLKFSNFFEFFLPSAPLQNQWGFRELQGSPLGRQLDSAKTHEKIKMIFFTNFSDFSWDKRVVKTVQNLTLFHVKTIDIFSFLSPKNPTPKHDSRAVLRLLLVLPCITLGTRKEGCLGSHPPQGRGGSRY